MTIQNVKRLAVIDGETLMDARLPKRNFCVETLLPEGISIVPNPLLCLRPYNSRYKDF